MKNRTERIYYDYNTAEPFKAEILECHPFNDKSAHIILNKTIFFPEGGGQPSDRGTINGIPVLDVTEKDGEILHLLSSGSTEMPKTGSAELVLDMRRRRDFSQIHTGQHLLSAVILRMTGVPTVSMHLGDENCTIDVDTAAINDENLLVAEEAVADAIEENLPVTIHLCPPEDLSSFPLRKPPPMGDEVIRVVEIKGHDFIACCGTHVKSTAEIGLLRIYFAEKYKGMTRISFSAGRRLLRDSRLLRQNALTVSKTLSVPINETGQGLLDYMEKVSLNDRRLKSLEEYAVRIKSEALIARVAAAKDQTNPVIIVESYTEEEINEVMNIGKTAIKECALKEGNQKQNGAVFILASEQNLKFAAFSSVKDFDLRPCLKDPLEKLGGKGGGGASFFQGSFTTKEDLETFLGLVRKL